MNTVTPVRTNTIQMIRIAQCIPPWLGSPLPIDIPRIPDGEIVDPIVRPVSPDTPIIMSDGK